MPRKPKFKPVITRIKLNPEQAVLSCNCFNTGTRYKDIGQYVSFPSFFGCNSGKGHAGLSDNTITCHQAIGYGGFAAEAMSS